MRQLKCVNRLPSWDLLDIVLLRKLRPGFQVNSFPPCAVEPWAEPIPSKFCAFIHTMWKDGGWCRKPMIQNTSRFICTKMDRTTSFARKYNLLFKQQSVTGLFPGYAALDSQHMAVERRRTEDHAIQSRLCGSRWRTFCMARRPWLEGMASQLPPTRTVRSLLLFYVYSICNRSKQTEVSDFTSIFRPPVHVKNSIRTLQWFCYLEIKCISNQAVARETWAARLLLEREHFQFQWSTGWKSSGETTKQLQHASRNMGVLCKMADRGPPIIQVLSLLIRKPHFLICTFA